NRLFYDISFPRRTAGRVIQQLPFTADTKQLVQHPGVAEIDLGGLNLPLFQVGVPRLKLAHHEHAFQQIKIASDRRFSDAERTCRRRCVPYLAMTMGKHGPETDEHSSGNADPELGDIPLDKSKCKALEPRKTVIVRRGQVRAWKAPPQPVAGL